MLNQKKLIVLSGKGGVGKSTLARALITHAARKNIAFRAFDGDGSNASLARFHSEVDVIDVDGDLRIADWYESQVIPALLADDCQIVLLDLGAGAERLFRTWCIHNQAVDVLAGESVAISLWHVLDPTLDAVSPLLEAVQLLPQVEHVVWLNHGLAKGLDVTAPDRAFDAIRREPEFIDVVRDRKVCVMPPLLEGPLIDAQDLSFEEALATHGPLALFQRLRVKRWLEQVGLAIDQVF